MGSKPTYVVAYTGRRRKLVKTKKRGNELMRVWKRWYERKGWKVRSAKGAGYIAYSPDYAIGRDAFAYPLIHAIVLRETSGDEAEFTRLSGEILRDEDLFRDFGQV